MEVIKIKKLLPLGSVVLLEGGEKKLMIYGRVQKQENTNDIWDYIGCLYPEGNISEEYVFLFNHSNIKKVYHEGYSDEEEAEIQKLIQQSVLEGVIPE